MPHVCLIKQCAECGYCLEDLKVETETARCPECGVNGVPRIVRPFPGFGRAVRSAIMPAVVSCNACLVLLAATLFGSEFFLPLLVIAFLVAVICGLLGPVETYTTISAECDLSQAPRSWAYAVLLASWILNATIGCTYLLGAYVAIAWSMPSVPANW